MGPAPLSQGWDAVPERSLSGYTDRSWRWHSVAIRITGPDTNRLMFLRALWKKKCTYNPCKWTCQSFMTGLFNTTAPVGIDFLNKTRGELEYRLDVCRVSGGSHSEHVKKSGSVNILCNKLHSAITESSVTISFQICTPYYVTPCRRLSSVEL
jgi:hypothetical protein